MQTYPDKLWSIITCPQCSKEIEPEGDMAVCRECSISYPWTKSGQLDLRLQRPLQVSFELELGNHPVTHDISVPLPLSANPQVDFSGIKPPHHLSRELLSYFPKAASSSAMALDLGCGSTIHRNVCEHAGFQYIGLDYENPSAMVWGDAHALPFQTESFDFVLSIAMLEHVHYPLRVSQEAFRVLKPCGRFIGTVAFLEPFHSNSVYHHTHLGIAHTLSYGGFKIQHIAPGLRWNVISANAKGLFPKMPAFARACLVAPLQALHRLWWAGLGVAGKTYSKQLRAIKTAGSIAFVARKSE